MATSFDSTAYGISSSSFTSMSPGVQNIVSTLANYSSVLAQKNQQMPTKLSKKTLKKLWKQAESDPTIQKYYAQDLQIGTKTLQDNVHIQMQDYQQMTDQQKQDYINSKQQLDQTKAQAGQVYSGFRKQAQNQLGKSYTDVLASSKRQMQSQLNTLESQFEQTYGSKALEGLGLGTANVDNSSQPQGMQSNWSLPSQESVSYTPIGGLAGTQAQTQLADIEAEYQSLIADKQSKNQLNTYVQQWQALHGMN